MLDPLESAGAGIGLETSLPAASAPLGASSLGFQLMTANGKPLAIGQAGLQRAKQLMSDPAASDGEPESGDGGNAGPNGPSYPSPIAPTSAPLGASSLGFQLMTASGKPLAIDKAGMEQAKRLMSDLAAADGGTEAIDTSDACLDDPPHPSSSASSLGFQLTTASGKPLAFDKAGLEQAKRLMSDHAAADGGTETTDASEARRDDPSLASPMVPSSGRPASARTPLAQIRNHGLGAGVSRFGRENAGGVPTLAGSAARPSVQKSKTAFKAPRTNRKFRSPALASPGAGPQVFLTDTPLVLMLPP